MFKDAERAFVNRPWSLESRLVVKKKKKKGEKIDLRTNAFF